MLQILDHSLSRMRTSGHAALLAEMAVIRLASLEDLDSVAAAVDRLAGSAASAAPVRSAPAAVAPRAAVPQPKTAPAPPAPQKKTTDLTPPAADTPVAAAPEPVSPAEDAADAVLPVAEPPENLPAARGLPAEPLAAWQAVVETLDGLAADFAAEVSGAVWNDGVLEVSLPAQAATAASFLKRPEVASAIMRSLESSAGRQVRHVILLATASAAPATPTVAGEPSARPVATQTHAALLREVAEHPLVAHARTVFDAAIRKVDPPRSPRPVTIAAGGPTIGSGATQVADAGDRDDDGDHRSDEDSGDPMEDDNG
jgi:DNA polymerase III gamma/tau subunit